MTRFWQLSTGRGSPLSRCPQGTRRVGGDGPTVWPVRESNDPDDVVGARLRAVLDGPPAHKATPTPEPEPGPFADTSPVSWSELIPSWPDDVDLPEGDPASPPEPKYAWDTTALTPPGRPDDAPADANPIGGAGAFGSADSGRAKLWLLDPGRRGVKALAAVAVLVVIIAAVLAWRARPRVDPVDVPPVDAQAAAASTGRPEAPAPAGARPSAGADIVVAVGGKVRKPGLVRLPPGARVADALQAAGGADAGVDVAALNLARKVVDGELIMVGVTPPPGAATGPAAAPGGGVPAGGGPAGQVNLNTATLADLDTLPGVGPVLAQRILDARTAQGGFKSVSDLRKVDGIGDSRYEQLKDLVVV
jgi:competence protein ComEA